MPALDPMSERAFEFQYNFIKCGEAGVILDMLTKNKFLPNADETTKRSAYLTVLRLCKLLLTVMGNVMACVMDEVQQTGTSENHDNHVNNRGRVTVLKQALQSVPNQSTEYMLRSVAAKLAQHLAHRMLSGGPEADRCRQLFVQALSWELPDVATIRAIIRLAWAASTGNLNNINASNEMLHSMHETNRKEQRNPDNNDVLVCKEALEVLTIALVLNPSALETLSRDKMWHTFLIDLVLLGTSRAIRIAAGEQFFLISTWCSGGHQTLLVTISLLFTVLNSTVTENAKQSHEYFQLLCRLLNFAHMSGCPLTTAETLLNVEIGWLKRVRDNVKETGESQADEALLEGHLGLTKELLAFLPPNQKYEIGSDEKHGVNLIKELVEDFVFPASRLMLQLRSTGELSASQACPVCTTPQSTSAAFDLLVGLCVGCVPNMKLLVTMLTDMFYSEKDEPLVEWDYLPPVGLRPLKGFVGLKNAGATCYMNSVLQQLYMVESIRVGLLAAEGAATDLNEDFSGEERIEGEQTIETNDNDTNEEKCGADESRKEYNIGILKQVQAIFGHLAYSKLQYYIPRGLWKHFK